LVKRASGQRADIGPIILAELHAGLHKLAGSGGTFDTELMIIDQLTRTYHGQ
jgi:hypothetical protein